MTDYLIDTSVFVAAEQGRPLSAPPAGDARLSVATLTELRVGVLRATDERLRQLRQATYAKATRFLAVPYDEAVSDQLALLLAAARATKRKAGAMDAIIAATALAHDLVIWTQDTDFEVLRDLAPALQIHQA